MRLTRPAVLALALVAVALVPRAAHAAPTPQDAGYLGVQVADVDSASAARLHLPAVRGARVEAVADSSPARAAGLQKDDVITAFDGQRVESVAALTRMVGETPPGREVTLSYVRNGSTKEARVRVGERPGFGVFTGPDGDIRIRMRKIIDDSTRQRLRETMDSVRARMDSAGREVRHDFRVERFTTPDGGRSFVFALGGPGRLGVTLQPLSEQLGDYFGVGGGHGALISDVREGSPAAKAGLRAGDVIVQVAGKAVEDPADVVEAVHAADAGKLEVTVIRKGKRQTVTADLPERSAPGERAERWFQGREGGMRGFATPALPHPPAMPRMRWIAAPPAPGAPAAPYRVRELRGLPAPGAPGTLPAPARVWVRGVNRYI